MAGKSFHLSKLNYARPRSPSKLTPRLFSGESTGISHTFETLSDFNEDDIWNLHSVSSEIKQESASRNAIPSSRNSKRSGIPSKMIPVKTSPVRGEIADERAYSAPVNIPDWSKILKDDYRDCRRTNGGFEFGNEEDDDDCGENGIRVPPHELLAKQLAGTGISSFSVHEGIGRTLKGRDLRRVRNAIFERTGFQD